MQQARADMEPFVETATNTEISNSALKARLQTWAVDAAFIKDSLTASQSRHSSKHYLSSVTGSAKHW